MTILKEGTTKTYIYECSECGCIFTGGCLRCHSHSIMKWLEKEE